MDSVDQPKIAEKTRSKYELTLAEFPTFPVAKAKVSPLKPRVFEDTIMGKNREPIKRRWTIIPHAVRWIRFSWTRD